MWSHRRSRRESDPGALLRSHRAEPREEFVESLSERIDAERPGHRTAWSRLAFAGAASTLILGMFASFGGFGYAASGAHSTYTVVRQAVVHQKLAVHPSKSSAASQYSEPPAAAPAQKVAGQTQVKGSSLGAVKSSLPFTGLSLLATVLVGFALLVTGLILRRRERSDS
jgi:disulfide bond formation protein DsbB